MENKDKKDMSVDDLVKQLKLVLDIDNEEGDDSLENKKIEISDNTDGSETENDVSTSASSETISEKVRMYDEFFAEEENKKKKKKIRLLGKKDKKKQDGPEPAVISEPDDAVISDNISIDTDTADTAGDIASFADEISDMFSDEAETVAEEPEPEAETVAEKANENAVTEPENTDIVTSEENAEVPDEVTPDEPEVITIDDEDNDDLKLHITQISNTPDAFAEIDNGDISGDDAEPFVFDPSDSGADESFEDEVKTKPFAVVSENETEDDIPDTIAEEDDQQDIEDFNVSFYDVDQKDDNGYTSAEKAIMETFGESQEPPKKNPVKDFYDISAGDDEAEEEGRKNSEKTDDSCEEFVSYDQRKPFLDEYKKKYVSLRTSLIFSSIFAVLVFVYECLSFMGNKLPYFCSPETNPAVFILIDLQLFAFCAIFAAEQIVSGIKGAFSGKSNIASISALAVIITFIYGILSAVTGTPVAHPVMSVPAFGIVMMLFAQIRCIKRDTLNFRVISGTPAKPKFVIESYTPGKNSAEAKEFHDYIPDNAKMLRISKTEFVKGFVKSNMKPSSSNKLVNILFPILALIFVVILAVVLIIKKDVSEAVNASYTVFAICTPAALFAAITLPSFYCAAKTHDDSSCIVSEAAAEEYAEASVVTFEDSDVFPPSLDKITSVRLYNDSRMDHIMYVLTSLFRKIGGPLLTICENAAKEYNEYSNNVVIENAVENGIEATVDSQKVFLGSSVYMGSKLDPKYCIDDRQYAEDEKSRIMYMIINDVVTAKFYIEYEMDKDFISIIKQLSTAARCVAIRTLDPNIDTKLIKSFLDTEIYHCKIMRNRDNERRKTVSESSRGAVVSRHSIKALLRSLMLCDKMAYATKINMIICFLSVIIGVIFGVFLTITNTVDSISAIHVLAYQILLGLVIWIVTKINT